MLGDPSLINEGLELIKRASNILEAISDQPGVTPLQFYAALDSRGILEYEEREVLLQAASNIEMSLELVTEISHPTIH